MAMTTPESSRVPSLLPVFLIVLVDVFGMTLVIPLLAIYAESLHATPLQATMLVAVFAACQLVAGPIIGHISDRVGRKPMLLVSQAGTFVGFIVMAQAKVLWMLYLARVLDGATAGNLSLAQAYIADHTPPAERAKSFALIGIAFGVGFFIGPSLTGYLAARFGMTAPIYLAAMMSAASIVCTAMLLQPGQPVHSTTEGVDAGLRWSTYTQYFRRPGLTERLMQFLCFSLAFSLFTSGFALFAERRFMYDGHPFGPREIGYLFGYAGFLGIVIQGGLIDRLVKRFGEHSLLTSGLVALAIGYTALGMATSVLALILVVTVAAYGTGVIRPAVTSLITQAAGRTEQGVVLGVTQSLMSLAAIVSPVVAGLLIERHLLAEWAWAAASVAAIGLLPAFRASRHGDARMVA